MGELPDHTGDDFERFAARWLAALVAVMLRAVREPVLAYYLATETLASARVRWSAAPSGPAREHHGG